MTSKLKIWILIIAVALIIVSGCTWFGKEEGPYPKKEISVEEPGGAVVHVDPDALDQQVEITLEDVGSGEPLGAQSSLTPASNEYVIEFGGAEQIGGIVMTVPLNGSGKDAAPMSSDRVYAVWAQPGGGNPAMVGVLVEDNMATFPVVGSGVYQVYGIPSHEVLLKLAEKFEPLTVPTYHQYSTYWCSTTALTNLAQYHQGSWPAGGLGSVWGETSNYYLAGQSGQETYHGFFFHWLLEGGGYSVPEDVKQSFSNEDAEVIIWNWKALAESGYSNPGYFDLLFNFFQAYVESYLWGLSESPRPVAWGSGREGHSRTITGSDSVVLFYNDPAYGSLHETRSWEQYRQIILDSLNSEEIEIIDTAVFHAPPRPVNQRTGVIWLSPANAGGIDYPGSISLWSGKTGIPLTDWVWDGSGNHGAGYYYRDLTGSLESAPDLGAKFEVFHPDDTLQIWFEIKNITDVDLDYSVEVHLSHQNGSINELLFADGPRTTSAGSVEAFSNTEEPYRLANKPSGLYTLKFILKQGAIATDVKWVMFYLNQQEVVIPQLGIVNKQAFCRLGPDPVFEGLLILQPGTEGRLIGVNSERTWGKFDVDNDGEPVECWMSFSVVDLENEEDAPVVPEPIRPTMTPTFSCSDYADMERCTNDSRCTWVAGIGPGYCTER